MSTDPPVQARSGYELKYPNPICMMCVRECSVAEVVSTDGMGGHLELWCKVDTFHPPTNDPEHLFSWS